MSTKETLTSNPKHLSILVTNQSSNLK